MKLADSIQYPFRGSWRWQNIGLLALCNLIPIVGPMVAMGFGVLVEKDLIRDINAEAPLFDFGNFTKYLERGVAPFVVGLILGVVVVPLTWALMLGGFLAVTASHDSPIIAAVVIAVLIVAWFVCILAFTLVMWPIILRASLLGKIGAAFDFRWVLDFIKRVGGRMLLALLVMQLLMFPMMIAGMCLLYVGMFAALAIANLMMWHLQVQLYNLYVDRGGTPLVILDEPMLPAFPVEVAPPRVAPSPDSVDPPQP